MAYPARNLAAGERWRVIEGLGSPDTSQRLTEHFSRRELLTTKLPRLQDEPTPAIWSNLQRTAELLETVRSILSRETGRIVPLKVNSGYRSVALNSHRNVGGVSNSQHLWGQAADFVPLGVPIGRAYEILKRFAGRLGFRQLLGYPDKGFIHISTPGQNYSATQEAMWKVGTHWRLDPLPEATAPAPDPAYLGDRIDVDLAEKHEEYSAGDLVMGAGLTIGAAAIAATIAVLLSKRGR